MFCGRYACTPALALQIFATHRLPGYVRGVLLRFARYAHAFALRTLHSTRTAFGVRRGAAPQHIYTHINMRTTYTGMQNCAPHLYARCAFSFYTGCGLRTRSATILLTATFTDLRALRVRVAVGSTARAAPCFVPVVSAWPPRGDHHAGGRHTTAWCVGCAHCGERYSSRVCAFTTPA